MDYGPPDSTLHFGDPRVTQRVGHGPSAISGYPHSRAQPTVAQMINQKQRACRKPTTSTESSLSAEELCSGTVSSSEQSSASYSYNPTYWKPNVFDLEAGCVPWTYARDDRLFSWLPAALFGSKMEQKARNPGSCDSIGYGIRGESPLVGFAWRFSFFFLYCFAISLFHPQLGLPCTSEVRENPMSANQPSSRYPGRSLALVWAETLVTTGACFLIAQGYYGIRATRERMERVRQTAVTLAYSFIKTTTTDTLLGHSRDELQVVIYECLALLTAYPVALLYQLQGNTCEPAIPSYCQEVAKSLKRLRDGEKTIAGGFAKQRDTWTDRRSRHQHQFETVEYFFEIFSLHLQMEFSRQPMRTKSPSLTSQHIIYQLRNHFENIVDLGNLDDRRTPIVRENIDMLALAGRECGIFSYTDVAPVSFLWTVDVACRLLSFGLPAQNCDWLVNSTMPPREKVDPVTGEPSVEIQFPTMVTILSMAGIAVISATILTVLNEMWKMWDPFGRGTNTYAWTLGVAMEIDNLVNEFYEYDTKGLVRMHAYMDSSHPDNWNARSTGDSRPQTV